MIIFITSFARSGSSWFGSFFNSHPDVIYRHEPLGRLHGKLGDKILPLFKNGHLFRQTDRKALINTLTQAHYESDRPPFFRKRYEKINPVLKYIAWGLTTKLSCLDPVYTKIMSPTFTSGSYLVLKETGWSVQLPTIIKGLKPDTVFFLSRYPCGVVASFLNGYRSNMIQAPKRDGTIIML